MTQMLASVSVILVALLAVLAVKQNMKKKSIVIIAQKTSLDLYQFETKLLILLLFSGYFSIRSVNRFRMRFFYVIITFLSQVTHQS